MNHRRISGFPCSGHFRVDIYDGLGGCMINILHFFFLFKLYCHRSAVKRRDDADSTVEH